jgi:hypothetical protein
MAANGTSSACKNGTNGVAQPLNRADELDDVSGKKLRCETSRMGLMLPSYSKLFNRS